MDAEGQSRGVAESLDGYDYVALAKGFQSEGLYQEALDAWIHAAARSDSPAVHVGAARCALHLGDYALAWAHAQQALELDPTHAPAALVAARLLRARGDHVEALAILGQVAPGDRPVMRWVTQAKCESLIALGHFAEARAAALEADDGSAPWAARAAELAGRVHLATWRLRQAEQALEEACSLEPTPLRWSLLARCRLLVGEVPSALEAQRSWAAARRATLVDRLKPEARNIRGTHGLLGQQINEELIDRSAMSAAQRAIEAESVDLAREGVLAYPSALSTARALLTTLRISGLLADREPSLGGTHVPRFMGQAWLGGGLPADASGLTSEWRDFHEDWQYVLLNQESAREWLTDHFDREVTSAFIRARHPAAAADLLRLAFLHVNGGVWMDVDDRVKQPIDSFVARRDLVLYHEPMGTVGNNFIAVAPEHPVITGALSEAVQVLLEGYTEPTWLATGPGLLTRSLARWLATDMEVADLGSATFIALPHEIGRYVAMHQRLGYKKTSRSWQRASGFAGHDARPRPVIT